MVEIWWYSGRMARCRYSIFQKSLPSVIFAWPKWRKHNCLGCICKQSTRKSSINPVDESTMLFPFICVYRSTRRSDWESTRSQESQKGSGISGCCFAGRCWVADRVLLTLFLNTMSLCGGPCAAVPGPLFYFLISFTASKGFSVPKLFCLFYHWASAIEAQAQSTGSSLCSGLSGGRGTVWVLPN